MFGGFKMKIKRRKKEKKKRRRKKKRKGLDARGL